MKLTATKAIELSIEQWTLMTEGFASIEAYDEVCETHGIKPSWGTCFLCNYNDGAPDCKKCPCVKVTGVFCIDLNERYFWNEPDIGLSALLAIQYYFRRKL